MPKRKRTNSKRRGKRSFKRRKMVSRRRRNYSRAPIPKSLSFKDKLAFTKMRYVQSFQTTSAVFFQYVFRANGTYDPNYTGTGTQPFLHDEAYSLYDQGTVLGSKLTLQFSGADIDLLYSVRVSDTVFAPTSPAECLMGNHLQYRLVPLSTSGTLKKNTITSTWSAPRWYGKSKTSIIGDGRFRETVNTNPSEGMYYCITICAPDGITLIPAAMTLMAQIDYAVVLSEPIVLGQS